MKHIVMFSGGIASDECARRVKALVDDPSTITLLFADTKVGPDLDHCPSHHMADAA